MEETVKKNITSLLISSPIAMRMEQLGKDYRNMIGEPIPYVKLGYRTLDSFLRTITDTVIVNGVGPFAEVIPVLKEKSAHINKLVTNQKISFPKKKKAYNTPFIGKRKIFYPQPFPTPSTNKYIQQSNDQRFVNQLPKLMNNVSISNTNRNLNPATNTAIDFNRNLESKKVQINNRFDHHKEFNNLHKMNSQNAFDYHSYEKKDIQDVNVSKTYNDVEKSSKGQQAYSRNESNHGLGVSPEHDNWNSVHLAKVKKALMERQKSKMKDSDMGVPLDIQNNLKKLIEKYPEGVWCAKLPQIYRQLFYKELKYEMLGFTTLSQLCTSLPSIFHFVRPEKGDFKLYDRNKPLPMNVETSFTIASYSKNNKSEGAGSDALPKIDWEDVINFLPEDTFKPGQEIPRAFISPETQVNDNIDIVVGEIYDLSKFWIHLNDGLLDKLMDDMQIFYKNHANEYLMPQTLLRVGIYCVQVIFGEYHRALIVDTLPDVEGSIKVIFFDYGTMTKVSTEGLCFLHSKFAQLKAQAIRCRLSNICPPEEGSPWNVAASKAFRNMVYEKKLCGKITHINRDEQFIEIYLADVTDPNNIYYINDRLVENDFAQYPDKALKKSMVHTLCTPIVKYLHLFPTFLELEYGVVPSTSEMEVLADCNVPINFCYPQYFTTDQSAEIKRIKHVEEFFDCHLKGKRNNASHYIDLTKFKAAAFNTSIFKDLESEIIALRYRCTDLNDCEDSTSELLIDAATDKEFNVAAMFTQLNEFKTQTVLDLHKDCELSYDIIRDVEVLCSGNDVNNLGLLWTKNENYNSSSEINNSDDDEDAGDGFVGVHPLYNMSFDKKESAHSSDSDESEDNVNCKVEEPSGDSSILEEKLNFVEPTTNTVGDTDCTSINTNPFLSDLDELEDSVGEKESMASSLNPNNPFLKFLTSYDVPEFSPDNSRKSSCSTIYDSFVQDKSDDVNLAETASGYSASSNSAKMSRSVDRSIQTPDHNSDSPRHYEQQSSQPPIAMAPPRPYANNCFGYGPYTGGGNPYPQQVVYNMNQQMYRYGYGPAHFPNGAPGLQNMPMRPMGPGNGFMGMQNGPMGMQNGPMGMQNGPMGMMQGGGMPNEAMGYQGARGPSQIRPPPGFTPNSNIYNNGFQINHNQQQLRFPMYPPRSDVIPQQQLGVPSSLQSNLGNQKDFYEAYNELLLLKMQQKTD